MPSIQNLVGKPLTFNKGDKKRQIGTIIGAEIKDNAIVVTTNVTDRDVAQLLGVDVPSDISGSVPLDDTT